ncbi:MAG: glycoside hydrolase family 38 C-terminal domain-containing protein [Armatimonadota bacterium]|nr:glycoside hydrolase family 38 C-terminal domain-containing protein [Armatimonadota bacterium]
MSTDDFIVHLTPGFHSDVVWLEDQRDYAVSLMGDVKQNLLLCRHDPDYGVFLHELTYLKPYFDTEIEDREYIRQLIREGRIATGGSHSQPMETCIGPEGLVRNILYGRLYHEKVLGDRPEVYMPWDVFGHIPQLSQILAKSRFSACIWSKAVVGFHPLFQHQSLDGSKMLYRRTTYTYGAPDLDMMLSMLRNELPEAASYGLTEDVRVSALDFLPPAGWMAGECGTMKERRPSIRVSGSAHRKFFRSVIERSEKGELKLPVTARDMEYYHQGTRLTRVDFKIANRLAENLIVSAEKFGTVANLLGAKYPDKALDKAWRQLLLGQHHDGMAGPSCDRAYLDLLAGYRDAIELAGEALTGSLDYIGQAIDTSGKRGAVPLAVFNPVAGKRTDVCRATLQFKKPVKGIAIKDASGVEVSCRLLNAKTASGITSAEIMFIASNVPSLGYKLFYIHPANNPRPSTLNPQPPHEIENEFYRITVDPAKGGCMTSLIDKTSGRELIADSANPGNELVVIQEKFDRNEPPWEIFTQGVRWRSSDFAAAVTVEQGPAMSRIIVRGEASDTPYLQEIALYPGVKRIDFITSLENYRGKDNLFAMTFPGAPGTMPVFEERFGAVTGRRSKGKFDFRTWQYHNYSDHGLRAMNQFVDSNWSMLLKIEGRPDAAVSLGPTAIVVPHDDDALAACYRLQEALVKKGICCTPMYDDLESGRRRDLKVEECTIPGVMNEDLSYGTAFRLHLDIAGANRRLTPIFKTLGEQVEKEFRARLELNGFAYLFFTDPNVPEGWPSLPTLVVSARDAKALDSAVDSLIAQVESEVITLPPEAVAGAVPSVADYGMAILNRGHALAGMENDGTLVLPLMHNAGWAYIPWGPNLLPFFFVSEWKTHRFTYSLYPHEGSWREANVPAAAMAYNNPLVARQLTSHNGFLPAEMPFLEIDSDALVVTAMKPKGNPTASLSGAEADASSWITLRLYEPFGRKAEANVRFFTGLAGASSSNLLEERRSKLPVSLDGGLKLSVEPFSIETFELVPDKVPGSLPAAAIARKKEIAPVQHIRYWQHNLGADPIGYLPVTIALSGEIKTGIHIVQGGVTINTFKLGIANNYIDRRASGTVELMAPEGWRIVPDKVDFALDAGASCTRELLLAFLSRRRTGIIKARIAHEGQVFQDIIEVGQEHLLKCKAKAGAREIRVTLTNPTDMTIEGQLDLITPIETWPIAAYPELAVADISPWRYGFELEPGASETYRFPIEARAKPGYWAIARLVYNGHVHYARADGRTEHTEVQ